MEKNNIILKKIKVKRSHIFFLLEIFLLSNLVCKKHQNLVNLFSRVVTATSRYIISTVVGNRRKFFGYEWQTRLFPFPMSFYRMLTVTVLSPIAYRKRHESIKSQTAHFRLISFRIDKFAKTVLTIIDEQK